MVDKGLDFGVLGPLQMSICDHEFVFEISRPPGP
jgi:hypothetical protein